MAKYTNSPLGVIRGSVGELTFQMLPTGGIVRKKPYNTFSSKPTPPPWPYPISEETISFVDGWFDRNSTLINAVWAPILEDVTIEEQFKRANYLNCELFGRKETSITYGTGGLAAVSLYNPSGSPEEPGALYFNFSNYETVLPLNSLCHMTVKIPALSSSFYSDTFVINSTRRDMPVATNYVGNRGIIWRAITFASDRSEGSCTQYGVCI